MENEDQKPTGTGETQNPEGTAGSGEPKTPEGFVPKEQFAASQAEAIRLRKENEALKSSPQNKDLPEDKKKFREYLSEVEKEKAEEAKKEDEQLKSDLDKMHTIHGDFDDNKLTNIVKKYGVYDDDGNIAWERAYELYERLGGVAEYTPRKKAGARTSDKPLEAEKVEVRGKTAHEIVGDMLKKFGVGGQ